VQGLLADDGIVGAAREFRKHIRRDVSRDSQSLDPLPFKEAVRVRIPSGLQRLSSLGISWGWPDNDRLAEHDRQ